MKVIIAGGRDFDNYELLRQVCNELLLGAEDVEIVSGTAKGADTLGEKYALNKGLSVKKFPANWNEYGRSAGFMRNKEMADYGDMLIAFWDGQSRGTQSMILLSEERGLKVHIVKY